MTLPGARWTEKQSVFPPIDELGGSEIEDEAAIHLLVEIEVEGIEIFVGVAKLSVLDAALEQTIGSDGELVGDQRGDEIDRSHLSALGFENSGL